MQRAPLPYSAQRPLSQVLGRCVHRKFNFSDAALKPIKSGMSTLAKIAKASDGPKQSFEVVNLKRRLHELLKKDEKLSNTGSFGYVVLSLVAQGSYERAKLELEMVHIGLEEYTDFENRARRFIEHAKSLVIAIKIKSELCASEKVGKAKEKELANTVVDHFVDLRKSIIAIERIQKSVKSADMRSTAAVLRVFFFCVVAVFIAYSAYNVFPQFKDIVNSKAFNFFHWEIPQ
jgi:hypothetical protein